MRGRAVTRELLRRAGFIAALALLSGCASWTTGDASVGTDTADTTTAGAASVKTASISASKPFDAYVVMGGHIKSCWFNADAPLLPKYVYRADVSPDSTKVMITIHDRAELGRAGMSTYTIDFKQAGPSTVITTENRKMPANLAAKMQYDIDRWKRGESDCNKTMPPPPADITAAIPPPKRGPAPKPAGPKSAVAQKPAAH
jgi:hypothetical protein